jgi:hypothetical protein
VVRHFRVAPLRIRWCAAAACGKALFLAGYHNEHLIMIRTNAEAAGKTIRQWPVPPRLLDQPILLAAAPDSDDHLLVHAVGGPLLEPKKLSVNDVFSQPITVGPIEGMPASIVAAARTNTGLTTTLELEEGFRPTLRTIMENGEPLSTDVIRSAAGEEQWAQTTPPVPFHVRADKTFVGVSSILVTIDRSRATETIELSHPIRTLCGSVPHTRPRVAATYDSGGEVLWFDFGGYHRQTFADEMPSPVVCINRGGYLIAAGGGTCEVYSLNRRRARLIGNIDNLTGEVIGILPMVTADQFAVVRTSGEVTIYSIP